MYKTETGKENRFPTGSYQLVNTHLYFIKSGRIRKNEK